MRRTTSMTLGPELDSFIDRQVEMGRYASASEVLRAGIRELEKAEQRRVVDRREVNRAFADGFDSGSAALLRWISLQHCSTEDCSQSRRTLVETLRRLADEVEADLGLADGISARST